MYTEAKLADKQSINSL